MAQQKPKTAVTVNPMSAGNTSRNTLLPLVSYEGLLKSNPNGERALEKHKKFNIGGLVGRRHNFNSTRYSTTTNTKAANSSMQGEFMAAKVNETFRP